MSHAKDVEVSLNQLEELSERGNKGENFITKTTDLNNQLRERSGNIDLNSRLISFLYELMRDHVPAGTVEKMVRNSEDPDTQYCNGWLAKYAEDVANRLK